MENNINNIMTIDVEDWFHVLDGPFVPKIKEWNILESRVVNNVEYLLELLSKKSIISTMFWLGWVAERNPKLLKKCFDAGHEIASHGYAHVLAYNVGPKVFGDDIRKGKQIIEDIIGQRVNGFRAAGFSTKNNTTWTFEEIRAAGYIYDSSVFPAARAFGGMSASRLEPHIIHTSSGSLVEIPQSMIEIFGKRFSVFGGGYLRLAPIRVIKYGIRQLEREGRPLIIYVHPREIDPYHPRLPLSPIRFFKCYVNIKSTVPKLEQLLGSRTFIRMDELASMVAGYSL
jgi:polysaccharide deacetylase family protein (PEP-CTERM system associated)